MFDTDAKKPEGEAEKKDPKCEPGSPEWAAHVDAFMRHTFPEFAKGKHAPKSEKAEDAEPEKAA